MDIQRLLTSLSTRIIIQFVAVLVLAIIVIGYNFESIYPFYFENQVNQTGIIINTAIATLLFIGLGNILFHLLRYRQEEAAIAKFVNNVESLRTDPTEGLEVNSVLVKRYANLRSIESARGEINHGALASMLNADESTRFGLIRFINNILILTGVFGTIVSLSIALLGASDLIDSAAGSLGGMGLVIYGMSTALSTTITAIVSYVIFGYFYTRLNDVQTHFLSGVEHLTSVYLLPQFVKSADDTVYQVSELLESVNQSAANLKLTQEIYHETASQLQQNIDANQRQIESLTAELDDIKTILRQGFRLPQPENRED
ncbi:MAG: hypothetical protein AAF353_15980 [Pseudomonadota bacterium]